MSLDPEQTTPSTPTQSDTPAEDRDHFVFCDPATQITSRELALHLEASRRNGDTYLLIVTDTFDYESYFVSVSRGENLGDVLWKYNEANMQRVSAVYNLMQGDSDRSLNKSGGPRTAHPSPSSSFGWWHKLNRSKALALEAHGDQRYGTRPYREHLEAVETVATRFGATLQFEETAAILCAAWLHDTLEDTDLKPERIAAIDPKVLDLVWRVTDEPGATRAERKHATYPKIAGSPVATALKLADRIANVEACVTREMLEQLEKYRAEQPGFREAVFRDAAFVPGLVNGSLVEMLEPMWRYLDSL